MSLRRVLEEMKASKDCKAMTLDFIIKENDPEVAAVEDDIVKDLAKIGIKVNTRILSAEDYIQAELNGDYHLLFSRTWGAPYDPHSYLNSWAVPAHVEFSAIGGMDPPLTRDDLLQMINEVQLESNPRTIADKWKIIHQEIHNQAMFLPLWGARVPYVINQRFGGFTPSSQTYSYPLESVTVLSGSKNVKVAPGAGGSLFKSVGPVNPHQYFPNQLFAQSWVYEGLVGYGQDGQPTAKLATNWVVEDLPSGGQSFTFTLRENVTFHDGELWTCEVAKLNFDHVLSDTVKQRHQWYGTPQQIQNWSCNANGQFVIETKDKFYPLLQELSYIRPLTFASPGAFAGGINSDPDTQNSCNSGDFGSKWSFLEDSITCAGLLPIGTGPFKLQTQVTNDDGVDIEAVFARHEDYYGTVPDIETLELKYYETTEEVEAALLSGDLDMALGIGPLTAQQVQDLKFYHADVVNVRHSDVLQHALLVMNTNAEHTKDIETRRAIIHAVDKSVFIEEEFAGLEQPVDQLLPFSAPYCNVDLSPKWAYDFEKAELLNCPARNNLGGGAITGIVVGCLAFVGLLGFVYKMYSREKAGKPMFAPMDEKAIE